MARIAARLGGGGHPNAAGLIRPGSLADAKAVVLGAIREALAAPGEPGRSPPASGVRTSYDPSGRGMAPDGLLLADKGPGVTSFQVVAHLRRVLRVPKVGHGGTLDPMATGLLPILLGEATKLTALPPGPGQGVPRHHPARDRRRIPSTRPAP